MAERRLQKEAFAGSISSTLKKDYTISEGCKGQLKQSDTNEEKNVTQKSVINRKRQCPFYGDKNMLETERAKVNRERYGPSDGEKILVKFGGKEQLLKKKEAYMILSHVQSRIDGVKNSSLFKRREAKTINSKTDGTSMVQPSTAYLFDGKEKQFEPVANWTNDHLTAPKELNKMEECGEENCSRRMSTMQTVCFVPNNMDTNACLYTSTPSINRQQQMQLHPEQKEMLSSQSAGYQSHSHSTMKREMNRENSSYVYNGLKNTGVNGTHKKSVNGLPQTGTMSRLSRLPQTGEHRLAQTEVNAILQTRVNGLSQTDIEDARKQARTLFLFHAYRYWKKKNGGSKAFK